MSARRKMGKLPIVAMLAAMTGMGAGMAAPPVPAHTASRTVRETPVALPVERATKGRRRQRFTGRKKPRDDAKRLPAHLAEWYAHRSDNGRRRFRAVMFKLGAHTDGEWYWPRNVARGSQATHRIRRIVTAVQQARAA